MSHEWKIGDWFDWGGTRYLVIDVYETAGAGRIDVIDKSKNIGSRIAVGSLFTHLPDCTGWDWEPPKPIEAPHGYRLLKEGEVILASDIYFHKVWGNLHRSSGAIGLPWNARDCQPIARKIEPPNPGDGWELLEKQRTQPGDELWVNDQWVGNQKFGFMLPCGPVFYARRRKAIEPPPGYRLLFSEDELNKWDMAMLHTGEWIELAVKKDPKKVTVAQCMGAYHKAFARKIEPRYRPFANAAEYEPFAEKWIIRSEKGRILPGAWRPVSYSDIGIYPGGGLIAIEYADAFKVLKFKDGAPFGVPVNASSDATSLSLPK